MSKTETPVGNLQNFGLHCLHPAKRFVTCKAVHSVKIKNDKYF